MEKDVVLTKTLHQQSLQQSVETLSVQLWLVLLLGRFKRDQVFRYSLGIWNKAKKQVKTIIVSILSPAGA